MYGMMPRANTAPFTSAPPVNILYRPTKAPPAPPDDWSAKNCWRGWGSIPGKGMCAPTRATNSNDKV